MYSGVASSESIVRHPSSGTTCTPHPGCSPVVEAAAGQRSNHAAHSSPSPPISSITPMKPNGLSWDHESHFSPRRHANASAEAVRLGGHRCCHSCIGTSASGSKAAASRAYSSRRQARRRSSPRANCVSRANCRSATSGGASPRMPMPFMRLCRPSAKGRSSGRSLSLLLTSRQSWQASHDHRDVPPAVARKQMMQRSYSRHTSAPDHVSGWCSQLQDCHSRGPGPGAGPRICPHGMCTPSL